MTLTEAVLLGVAILLGVYDLAVALDKGFDATISATIYRISKQYPALPFLVGLLMGHLFFPLGML